MGQPTRDKQLRDLNKLMFIAGISMNLTDDLNQNITILYPGIYKIEGAFSFTCDTNNVESRVTPFINNNEIDSIHFVRKIGTGGDIGSASFTGYYNISSVPSVLDVRLRHDYVSDVDFTFEYANFNIHYVGEN